MQAKTALGKARPRVVASYDYTDEDGRVLFRVRRIEPGPDGERKTFRQYRPNGAGGWLAGLEDSRRVLYRTHALANAPADRPAFVVEGEKDADRLAGLGLLATTNPMGAGKWRPGYSEQLRGRHVFVLPDNDDAGRKHAAEVAASLRGVAASVLVVELPGLPPKGDVSDFLDAQGDDEAGKQFLLRLVMEATEKAAASPRPTPPDRADGWEHPIPLGRLHTPPPFPVAELTPVLGRWSDAVAEALQVPPDLPAMLAVGTMSAGLARKLRARPRPGWSEPLNTFGAVALPPGERKTAAFALAVRPVEVLEQQERERMRDTIARAASEHRVLENRLKAVEKKAGTAEPKDLPDLRREAAELSREVERHVVPPEPEFLCDDVTPEKLGSLLAAHGGRMFQAAPEGTPFEIAKGRYSDAANFDVYLKGHAGDPIRTGRMNREREVILRPALTVCLAVQPDVISGLASEATMAKRGFLARWWYSMPDGRVGFRKVAAPAIDTGVAGDYHDLVTDAWKLPAPQGDDPEEVLEFDPDADAELQAFERWLEPQLAPGAELSRLAGWANKLAGSIVRLAGILHVADALADGVDHRDPVTRGVVGRAIRIGRDYLLPHALIAFDLMGADERLTAARQVMKWALGRDKPHAPVTRSEIHQANRALFKTVDDLDGPLDLLQKHNLLRRAETADRKGPGRKPSPPFEVNPAATIG